MTAISFSVVVPATNRPTSLEACLAGIRGAVAAQDEIVLVDDGPSRSPARLRNQGAKRAQGDVLLFIDADVVLHEDAVERLRRAFEEDPDLVAAFGSYDDEPPLGLASRFRNLLHHQMHQEGAGAAETFWAGLGAIRREEFFSVRGFNGRRYGRPMLEDVELGLRLTDEGLKIRLMPEVQGRHLKRWSVREMLWADFRNRGIPWTRLLLERRRVPSTLNLGWQHRFTALSVVLAPMLAVAALQPLFLLAGLAVVATLNRRFYGLLLRKGGVRLATAGMMLHAMHHLVAAAAVPFGMAAHLRRRNELRVLEPLAPEPVSAGSETGRARLSVAG